MAKPTTPCDYRYINPLSGKHMTPLPDNIRHFLAKNHVVGLATILDGEPWAASCFYAFDATTVSLIILSDEQTQHAMAMQQHATIAGTIAGQPTLIPQIKGIQFVAQAQLLDEHEHKAAYEIYCQRHPIARLKRSAVWRLTFQKLKYTDNSLLLGKKTYWQRELTTP